MTFRCVKLNVSWEPMEIISWFDAFILVYTEKADVLWTYPDEYKIHSQYTEWNYHSIIVLKGLVKRRPERKNISPSLRAILTRDLYTCQYCSVRLTNSSGTRDHIIPESKGGVSSFLNLVACCKKCQSKKADKFLHEIHGMKLLRPPSAPRLSERLQNSIKISSSVERNSWKIGFKKLGMTGLLGD